MGAVGIMSPAIEPTVNPSGSNREFDGALCAGRTQATFGGRLREARPPNYLLSRFIKMFSKKTVFAGKTTINI